MPGQVSDCVFYHQAKHKSSPASLSAEVPSLKHKATTAPTPDAARLQPHPSGAAHDRVQLLKRLVQLLILVLPAVQYQQHAVQAGHKSSKTLGCTCGLRTLESMI